MYKELRVDDIDCFDYRASVLLAQSDVVSLDELVKVCRKHDKFDVATAHTGQEVIDAVNETCFDAVVLGLKFSDLTGATLAYLIHQFDPLVSLAFLTTYSSDVLLAGAQDLGFVFWDKDEKFQNLDLLCQDIYELALEIPCDDENRVIKRQFMKPEREEYLKYRKLILPESLSRILSERREKEMVRHG